MNNKGFTLVEILVAVVLIGLIFGIGIPGVMKISERSKNKSYETKKKLIEDAAIFYGESNKNILEEGICDISGEEYYCKKISINTLIEDGYLDNENKTSDEILYENPKNSENIKDKCVYIYKKNKRVYSYYSDENSCDIISNNKIQEEDYDDTLCKYEGNDVDINKFKRKNLLSYQILCKAKKNINGTIYTDLGNSFATISSETEKYLSYTEDDYGTSYYYRGNVQDNYVNFAGFIWRIVRINGNGSIRLILSNTIDNICKSTNSTVCTTTKFNDKYLGNAHIGYMYGNHEATTYNETHANVNSSIIKQKVDKFYETFLKNKYSKYLADSIFCGEKTIEVENTGIGIIPTKYKSGARIFKTSNELKSQKPSYPSLECLNTVSRYTVEKHIVNGKDTNGDLIYPIALISADELVFAGYNYFINNTNTYLHIDGNVSWWTMTPDSSGYYNADVFAIYSTNGVDGINVICNDNHCNIGIRPIINLKSDVYLVAGDGSIENPYKIELN